MSLLETRTLTAFYGEFQALYGIDTTLDSGETIAIIGANGAGKSTFLKAIAGLIAGLPDSVLLDGAPIGARTPAEIVKLGIALVPEGRRLFPSLTVEENLLIGCYGRKTPGPWTLDRLYSLFPILKERRSSAPPMLSGGQQQMATIGRALMSIPEFSSVMRSASASHRSSSPTSMPRCRRSRQRAPAWCWSSRILPRL
jgi:branched-chain amino acid transport system ATP-binding protein